MNTDLITKYNDQVVKDNPTAEMRKMGNIVKWFVSYQVVAELSISGDGEFLFEKTPFYKKRKKF